MDQEHTASLLESGRSRGESVGRVTVGRAVKGYSADGSARCGDATFRFVP